MSEVVQLSAPIHEVVVLEDRARITRRGSMPLTAGTARVRIAKVSPVIVDKTVTGRVRSGGARVIDARVRRRIEHEGASASAAEGSLAKLRHEADVAADELAARTAALTRMQSRAESLDRVASHVLAEIADEVARGRGAAGGWDDRLADLGRRERDLRREMIQARAEVEELEERSHRLRIRIAELASPGRYEVAEVELLVESESGGEVGFEIEYMVPSACWRPQHQARLEDDRVEIRTQGCIWQNTGEDWHEVSVVLSTERGSLGIEPPTLDDDILRVQRRSQQVEVEAREQDIQTTGLGGGARTSEGLPGVDDGGELVRLRPEGSVSIPSDGKPYRVNLHRFEVQAELGLVAMPELSPLVYLRSLQVNDSPAPLLAGPVELLRGSGLVGRTSILYVAPGERFELAWGPEAELRIRRIDRSQREKPRILSSWQTRACAALVLMSNIGNRERSIEVVERIPVSETDKVKIELDGTNSSKGTQVDSDGFVTWNVTIPAHGRASRELHYLVKKHEDVVGV